jgi:hypothetical protein
MANQVTFTLNMQDESFNLHDTVNYGLAILLNETSFSCCTLDFKRNKFLAIQQCSLTDPPVVQGTTDRGVAFRDFIGEIFEVIPWLTVPHRLIKIAYNGSKATLIPSLLYDPAEKEQYFRFNYKREPDEVILSDHLMPLDAWQVFSVPGSILETMRDVFPKSNMVHASGLLIESIWINYKNRINTLHAFLHVRGRLIDLMIFDGRTMGYFNTFPFQGPEEAAYYLIFVLEQLNINPEAIPLVLLGDIASHDGLSELLRRYVRHVETVRRNESYRYSYLLNQLPSTTCYPLLNFFSCGL